MSAAVAVIGVINLLFTYGVVRRVKEHETRIAELASTGTLPSSSPPVGTALQDFSATTTDGSPVDRALVGSGEAFIGFFDTGCAPCREQLPEFARLSHGSGQFFAFIAGDAAQARELAALFDDHAFVVIEEGPPSTAAALGVNAFPTLLMLKEGVVMANAVSCDGLEGLPRVQEVDAR
ncbi:TlpA family protein disulfide reductase [Actinomadura rudentiformis]|uniref:TlpA family protein disulfide reductase n=1 Tax=Actinomadura rudentiformis TaxID=359158 RepID=UPI00178C1F19|nr:hypothetical protein [Actinomadura rudentiformis]